MIRLQEAQSFSFWLVIPIFGYVKESGFVPSDLALYSRQILSGNVHVHQSTTAYSISAFSILLRRGHYLKHCSPAVSEDKRNSLLASPPFAQKLFDPAVLEVA